MPTVAHGTATTLNVYAGEIVTVAVPSDGAARVWQLGDSVGEPDQDLSAVDGGTSKAFGPFNHTVRYRLESLAGDLTYDTDKVEYPDSVYVDRTKTAARLAATSTAASAVTGAIPMASLADKLKALAAKSNSLPAAIGARADALSARIDSAEKRADAAFTGHEGVVSDVETGVKATEDALNQLTNAAPDFKG